MSEKKNRVRASGGRGGGEGEFCVGWQWVAVVGWQWCDGDGPVVVFKIFLFRGCVSVCLALALASRDRF